MQPTQPKLLGTFLTLLCLVMATGCSAKSEPEATDEPSAETPYSYTSANYDGIGKFYMGREISHVMGHRGAGWLEREGRVTDERTDLLLELLPIRADSVVADIGAGTGYFAFPMAEIASEGRVIAVDIQPEMLDIIEKRQDERGVSNIERVLSTESDPKLAPNSIDLVLIVDAYHEFSYPYEMGVGIYNGLKPGGVLALVEYRAEDPQVPIKRLHKMSESQAIAEMKEAGLVWTETIEALPQQHLMLFTKPDT